jgi:hypothetical protein
MSDVKTREELTAVRADYAASVCVAVIEALIAGGMGAQIPTELLELTVEVKEGLTKE